jgi:hypothetical protein
LTGRKEYEVNRSNSVSQLYIEDDIAPMNIENIVRKFREGMNFKNTKISNQTIARGKRNENITFPRPPSLLCISKKSLDMKCEYLLNLNMFDSMLNELLYLFVFSG